MTKPKLLNSCELKRNELQTQGLHRSSTSSTVLRTERSIWKRAKRIDAPIVFAIWAWTVESLAPVVKTLSRTEMTGLMEHIFTMPEVKQARQRSGGSP